MSGIAVPFPWYGSKRRRASEIWSRLGDPDVYAEPFAGSLSVLLGREKACRREVVCDNDGGICNFWRALRWAPEEVAYWADWPTVHDDLTARHRWLVRWTLDNADRLRDDPEFFDAKAAGWWVWGISLWIGGRWCHPSRGFPSGDGQMSVARSPVGGQGVSSQRTDLPARDGARPSIPGGGHVAGAGVSVQRGEVPAGDGKVPLLNSSAGVIGMPGERLLPWFEALADRLQGVIVLNRSWESAVTLSVLAQSGARPATVGLLLDPPYLTADRSTEVYGSDLSGESDEVAEASFRWMFEPRVDSKGRKLAPPAEVYRIAYCCHVGDFEFPAGWTFSQDTFAGIRREDRRSARDLVAFSPACSRREQGQLW